MTQARILIVEDSKSLATILQDSLRKLNYDVIGIANSGSDAIALAEEHKPDLVLMDVVLKGQMDGIEAATQIISKFNIPSVYLTSSSDKDKLEHAIKAGAYGYLIKPAQPIELHTTLQIALYKHKMETALKISEARYRAIVEDQTEFICRFSPDGTLTFVNTAYCRYFDRTREELLGTNFINAVFEEDHKKLTEHLASLDATYPVAPIEYRVKLPNGEIHWHRWVNRALFNELDTLIEYQSVGHDISERKKMEERLQYLSLHDCLTRLYNRAYFEQELRHLERTYCRPVGIVMCDVDGLKLVNDNLGHEAGDALLVVAANILQKVFRENDIVARIGGDEFAIILPGASITAVANVCSRLQKAIQNYNDSPAKVPLIMSLGYAATDDTYAKLSDLLKEADNEMYRQKHSNRHSSHDTMMRSLEKIR